MTCRMIGLLITLTLGLLVTPFAAEAQPAGNVSRIGLLMLGSASGVSSRIEGFRQGLRDLGWVEGQQIALEYRYAEHLDRLPDLAAELVRLPVALILAWGAANALAAKQATTTIPIVFVGVANPIGRGLVPSLAQPGGNITGIASEGHPEGGVGLTGKQLELLKDAVSTVSRVAMLFGQVGLPTEAGEQAREHVAPVLGLTLRHFYVQRPEDFTVWVFPAIRADTPAIDALYARGGVTFESRRQLADFALQHRLPMMGSSREHAEAGSLLSYGASQAAMWRRAAHYVDQILKGTTPANLPVAADAVRAGHQSQDRPGSGPHHPTDAPLPGRRSHPVSGETWDPHDEIHLQHTSGSWPYLILTAKS
jgi:putative ABC transport system substrate-binding protein